MNSPTPRTAFEDALRRSVGARDLHEARLYAATVEILRSSASGLVATQRLVERLRDSELGTLISVEDVREAAATYLRSVKRDMNNGTAAPSKDGAALEGAEAQITFAGHGKDRSAPSIPKRGPEHLKKLSARAAPSVFETMIAIAGRAIGDMRYDDLTTFAAKAECESALLRRVADLGAPPDPRARVRDYVPEGDLRRLLKEFGR